MYSTSPQDCKKDVPKSREFKFYIKFRCIMHRARLQDRKKDNPKTREFKTGTVIVHL